MANNIFSDEINNLLGKDLSSLDDVSQYISNNTTSGIFNGSGSASNTRDAITDAINDAINGLLGTDEAIPTDKKDLLGFLIKLDNSIKKFEGRLDKIFRDIENAPQETVDFLCEKASGWINYQLEYWKVKLLNNAGGHLSGAKELIEKFAPIIKAGEALVDPTPENIVEAVVAQFTFLKLLYEIFFKPYKEAIQFIYQLTSRIISIIESLNRLAQYTPPKAKDVNFNNFKIRFKPPTLEQISEAGNLPYPAPPGYTKPPKWLQATLDLKDKASKKSSSKNA